MKTMARPKKSASPKGRPKVDDPKKSLISLKGSDKYAGWLDGLIAHVNLPPTMMMELALREYAKNHGYDVPQPKR